MWISAIHVVCRPETVNQMGAIVSLSQIGGDPDVVLGQDGEDLTFTLRNRILTRRPVSWKIKNVLTSQATHDIIISYDGDAVSLFVDGRPASRSTHLGPGTALAAYFRYIKVDEMDGYTYIYYFLVFFIGGILIGIATRSGQYWVSMSLRLAFYLIPALVLEISLVAVSGRPPSGGLLAISICLAIAGSLWINADRQSGNPHSKGQRGK